MIVILLAFIVKIEVYFFIFFSIKDALQKLVGEKNAQIGLIKLFETFQDKKLNKHLIYVSNSILNFWVSKYY